MTFPEYRYCQFCRKFEDARGLIKYGVRHYAHTRCFRDAKGLDALLALPPGTLANSTPLMLPVGERARLMAAFNREE